MRIFLRTLLRVAWILGLWVVGPLKADDRVFAFVEPTEANVLYGMDHGAALLMDVYRPRESNGLGLVFIMGTGFTAYGEYSDVPLKELDRWLVENGIFPALFGGTGQVFEQALERGFTVFSLNHRLGPAHTWQTQLRDCQRAVQFIRHHADTYGIDPERLGGMGHSSGATLITFLGAVEDVADVDALDPIARQSSRLQAVVPLAGMHDALGHLEQRPAGAAMLVSMTGRPITYQPPGHPIFETYRQASTIHHITANDAPMLIFHGTEDAAVDLQQSQALAEALKAAGVPHELVVLPGADHGQLGEPMHPTPGEHAAIWLEETLRGQ
ncbi:MAG: alpha/beta hydrolase [Opitutales bacterium]